MSNSKSCIIYLHCNSGSRLEALNKLELAITNNYSLACLDFTGSGLSNGEYISLGLYEQLDVDALVNYLIKKKNIQQIVLWGRSMGAVTALLYVQKHFEKISAIVWDSGFSNLNLLAEEISVLKTGLPKFIIKGILSLIKKTIFKKIQVKFEDLCLKKNLDKVEKIPIVFLASREDTFVKFHHTENLFEDYKGPKKLIEIKGEHNALREFDTFIEVFKFLNDFVEIPIREKKNEGILSAKNVNNYVSNKVESGNYNGKDFKENSKENLNKKNYQSFCKENTKEFLNKNSKENFYKENSKESFNNNNNESFYKDNLNKSNNESFYKENIIKNNNESFYKKNYNKDNNESFYKDNL